MSTETLKAESNGLRGAIPVELYEPTPSFSEDITKLLKFHGIYQQHDRDVRGRNNRKFNFMVRTKLPGGRLTAQQYLVEDALADQFSQGDFRLTTRQGIQLHGVIKGDLQKTVRALNDILLTTLGACGDVERNVMFCPAPFGDPIRVQLQAVAEELARHLAPRTPAYHQIWLEDDNGKQTLQKFDDTPVYEPLYGKTYLPRKFKTAIAFPGDNCVDLLTNDVGLVALFDEGDQKVHGFNVYVGGGMGQTHNDPATYPRLATPLGYTPAKNVVDVVEKVIMVQRDFGDRTDRKHARMKYLVQEWGDAKFRAKVEEYLGYALEDFRPEPEMGIEDHLGWFQQVDGRWFYGIYVENGRVRDNGDLRIRSGLRALVQKFNPSVVITAQQNIILSGFTTEQKAEVEQTLRAFGIPTVEEISNVRRNAMACPALPTCGLALAEAERYLPTVIDQLEKDVADLGLEQEQFAVRMTGCPNGCARPYMGEIGLVGRTLGKYTIFLGGNMEGTRMNVQYRDLVPVAELSGVLRQVLQTYKQTRLPSERLGDWAHRIGVEKIDELVSAPVH
ncbi:MAG: NADPH-dependent assimilatory sulfite reductase hemoprotein subunit [Caldilineaceae bacterium]